MPNATYSGPYAAAFGAPCEPDPYCIPDAEGYIHCPTCRERTERGLITAFGGQVVVPLSPAPSEDSADRKAAEVSGSKEPPAERSPLMEPDSGAWNAVKEAHGTIDAYMGGSAENGVHVVADALRRAFAAGYKYSERRYLDPDRKP